MRPTYRSLQILVLLVLTFASSGRTLKAQAFPGCTLPFESIKETHLIDGSCRPEGDTVSGANRLQNIAKNNFCATGHPVIVTFNSFLKLQQAAENQNIPFGGSQNLPDDRSALKNILTTSGGNKIGESSAVWLIAFIVDAHYSNVSSGESVNCKLHGKENNDIHVMLGTSPSARLVAR